MPSAGHPLSEGPERPSGSRLQPQEARSALRLTRLLVGGRSSSADSTAHDTTNMPRRLLRLFQYERPKIAAGAAPRGTPGVAAAVRAVGAGRRLTRLSDRRSRAARTARSLP